MNPPSFLPLHSLALLLLLLGEEMYRCFLIISVLQSVSPLLSIFFNSCAFIIPLEVQVRSRFFLCSSPFSNLLFVCVFREIVRLLNVLSYMLLTIFEIPLEELTCTHPTTVQFPFPFPSIYYSLPLSDK